jgi:hypothetical protein
MHTLHVPDLKESDKPTNHALIGLQPKLAKFRDNRAIMRGAKSLNKPRRILRVREAHVNSRSEWRESVVVKWAWAPPTCDDKVTRYWKGHREERCPHVVQSTAEHLAASNSRRVEKIKPVECCQKLSCVGTNTHTGHISGDMKWWQTSSESCQFTEPTILNEPMNCRHLDITLRFPRAALSGRCSILLDVTFAHPRKRIPHLPLARIGSTHPATTTTTTTTATATTTGASSCSNSITRSGTKSRNLTRPCKHSASVPDLVEEELIDLGNEGVSLVASQGEPSDVTNAIHHRVKRAVKKTVNCIHGQN